ncbi:hypothetical protein L6R50_28190 [Myxococcota bacterium]|nr:hypothetical protein [Myxococcota bacterium]
MALSVARTAHGTAAELLHDVELLEVGWLRQLSDADAHLETLWKGCARYTSLDATDNRWMLASDGPPRPGWRCTPATPPAGSADLWQFPTVEVDGVDVPDPPACSSGLPTDDCPPLHAGSPCTIPEHGPRLMTEALFDLVDALAGIGTGTFALPVLLARSNRGETGVDFCDPAHFKYYDWPYVDTDGMLQDGGAAARFVLHPVDSLLAGSGANEDILLDEFMRQLLGEASSEWGPGTSLRYVQLGNELVGNTCPDALGWLILRLCELVQRCTPDLVRVFPGLASPSNRPLDPADPVDPNAYLDRTEDSLNQVFYHIVRAALVIREEGGEPGDDTRFEDIFSTGISGIERAWTNDADSLVTQLNDMYYDDYGASLDADFDSPSHALPATYPTDPTDPTGLHSIVQAVRLWASSHLVAPFQVMDFHWYNSRGKPGGFLYLSALTALRDRLRATLEAWWSSGETIPLWCTETGISSDRNPAHLEATKAEVVDGADTLVCYAHTQSCGISPAVLGEKEDFEYRIDPAVPSLPT